MFIIEAIRFAIEIAYFVAIPAGMLGMVIFAPAGYRLGEPYREVVEA